MRALAAVGALVEDREEAGWPPGGPFPLPLRLNEAAHQPRPWDQRQLLPTAQMPSPVPLVLHHQYICLRILCICSLESKLLERKNQCSLAVPLLLGKAFQGKGWRYPEASVLWHPCGRSAHGLSLQSSLPSCPGHIHTAGAATAPWVGLGEARSPPGGQGGVGEGHPQFSWWKHPSSCQTFSFLFFKRNSTPEFLCETFQFLKYCQQIQSKQ